jgi:hypothetical protein
MFEIKQKIIETEKETLLVAMLPESAQEINFGKWNRKNRLCYKCENQSARTISRYINIPKGEWEKLGFLNELIDLESQDANKLNFLMYYEPILKANEVYLENPMGKEKDVLNTGELPIKLTDFIAKMDKWQEVEKNVGNWYILKKKSKSNC